MVKTSINSELTTTKLNSLLNDETDLTTDSEEEKVSVNVPESFISKITASGMEKIVVKK